jgi:hypothetical protein
MDTFPDFLPNVPRLAELFGRPTSWLRDIKSRDERFPQKSGRGYSVIGVVALLRVRELERMPADAFRAMAAENRNAALRLPFLDEAQRARIAACPLPTADEALRDWTGTLAAALILPA